MLTNTSTGRSDTAATDAIIAAICSLSCSPEQSRMYNGTGAIVRPHSGLGCPLDQEFEQLAVGFRLQQVVAGGAAERLEILHTAW